MVDRATISVAEGAKSLFFVGGVPLYITHQYQPCHCGSVPKGFLCLSSLEHE